VPRVVREKAAASEARHWRQPIRKSAHFSDHISMTC
jgi:hypothetical protein